MPPADTAGQGRKPPLAPGALATAPAPRRSLPAPDEPPRTGAAPPEEGTTDGRTHRTAANPRRHRRPARLAAALATATALATLTPAPQAAASTTRGHEGTQRVLDTAVADGVPGALARARDRHGVWNGTAGTADLDTGRARGADDRFRIGSVTKTFVATVLLQLQGERRIDLDDTIDQHLPGLVDGHGHDGTAITLRQANHTSGISNYTADPEFRRRAFGEEFLDHRYDTWKPGQLVAVAMRHAPDFAPGTSWNYSNTNYILAGMVIEKVTGHGWEKEVERRILRPLGLRGTSAPAPIRTCPARPTAPTPSSATRTANTPTTSPS